jgi:c-di-GMP-binding flagellar brake protein YcgR
VAVYTFADPPVQKDVLPSMDPDRSDDDRRDDNPMDDRREHSRQKICVPVEIYAEGSESPFRCSTSDLSLGGCYLETLYPFPEGTRLELKLQINGTLLILANVATCHPQVGNGLHFVRMLPEDIEELRAFLDAAQKEERKGE